MDGANDMAFFGSGGRTYAIVTTYNDGSVQIMDVTDSAYFGAVHHRNSGGTACVTRSATLNIRNMSI